MSADKPLSDEELSFLRKFYRSGSAEGSLLDEIDRLRARERKLVEHLKHALLCDLDTEEIAEIRRVIEEENE